MTAAIIAYSSIISATISAIVAWLVMRLRIKSEIHKVRYEIQANYAQNLISERLISYKPLHSLIQSYAKSIQRREITLERAQEIFEKMDEWQSENGLILSSESNASLYTFIRKLRRIIQVSKDSFAERIMDNDKRTELIREAWRVELSLKNDIGVFAVEYFDPELKFRSYKEIDALSDDEES